LAKYLNKINSWYRLLIVFAIIAVGVISFPKIYEVSFPPKNIGTWEGLNYANQKITFAMKQHKELMKLMKAITQIGLT
jgi:hypothetical protein